MEPQSQQPNGDMTPEDAKAALGLSTRLSEQMLMAQMSQEAPVEPETAPEQELELEPEEEPDTGLEERLMGEIDKLREELGESDVQKEIRSIREELEQLKENE